MMKIQLLKFSIFSLLISLQIAHGQNLFQRSASDILRIKKLITAVESNPNNIKAHDNYLSAMDIRDPVVAEQYSIWVKRFSKSATVAFAIGKAYEQNHDVRGKAYLLKALNINPSLAEAWSLLSFYASLNGETLAGIDYMQRATQLAPLNADYAFYFALLFKESNPVKYDSLMVNVSYRFPDNERGAEALCYLAAYSFNENEAVSYYEALYKRYSKKQYEWFTSGMRDYYDILLNESPGKAFELALKMVLEIKVNRQDWKQRLIVARSFLEVRRLLENDKPAEAAQVLKGIDLKNKIMGSEIEAEETLVLFKAEAAYDSKNVSSAYDSIANYYSKKPSDKIQHKLFEYGAKLGLDSNKVMVDISKIRDKTAWKETDFSLKSYLDHKQVSLSGSRGKVVLLTYWFPSCGPCRIEFQHFESVLKKFNDNDITYLAINVNRSEDSNIIPIMKSYKYSFIPLYDEPNKEKGNLPRVQSAPTNYLIDQNGRVIFSDFRINNKNERTLELMISELLKTGNSKKMQ